jgi:hypothetical protein
MTTGNAPGDNNSQRDCKWDPRELGARGIPQAELAKESATICVHQFSSLSEFIVWST